MTLADVKNALLTVSNLVYHHVAPKGTNAPYIVWAEDSQADSLHGDGRMKKQVIEGTIDLFDKKEYSTLFSDIQTALNDAGVVFRLNYINYEVDTRLFHYEWVFRVSTAVD